jgi:hypothetical protein
MEEAAAHHAVQLKALDDRVQQVCRPALLWLCRDGIVLSTVSFLQLMNVQLLRVLNA